jgi:GNAT superfamily N-acetyltransferase
MNHKRPTVFILDDAFTNVQDILSLTNLLNQNCRGPSVVTKQHVGRSIRESEVLIIRDPTEDSLTIVATLTVVPGMAPSGAFGTIKDLCVDQAWKGQDLEAALIEGAVSLAREAPLLSLEASFPADRHDLQEAYFSNGFQFVATGQMHLYQIDIASLL